MFDAQQRRARTIGQSGGAFIRWTIAFLVMGLKTQFARAQGIRSASPIESVTPPPGNEQPIMIFASPI